jgi:hypothetical protein
MKVRRQHYVSQAYLSAWTDGTRLFCLRGGKVFAASTRDVAQQRDFYRLRELTDLDIALIEGMTRPMPEHVQAATRRLVGEFRLVTRLRRRIGEMEPPDPEALKALDVLVNNLEEQMHARVESVGMPFVKSMIAGDTGFLRAANGAPDFYYFLSVQHLRTKRMRETFLRRQKETGTPFLFERAWNVLTHIFATSMSWSLYSDRANLRVVLLSNDTGVPLITADQPLTNLLGHGDGTPPEKLAWYYPLSPSVAMVLTEPPYIYDRERVAMTRADVERFNRLIQDGSFEQIYASSREQLKAMVRPARPPPSGI